MAINYLAKCFTGTGEVKDFKFIQLKESDFAYIYQVITGDEIFHYEVFKRKKVNICTKFDPENKIYEYSETEFKEIYPKSEDFGVWGWTFKNFNKALEKFNTLGNDTTE